MKPGLLSLMQWLSPSFPVGGFTYSHGLEWAVSEGDVRDAAGLGGWLGAILEQGAGRVDAILLTQAMAAEADLAALDALGRALAASRERLAETLDQGTAFLRTTNALTGTDYPAMVLPVAVGAAARDLGLAPVEVAALYLQAFASNLVLAGVRFIPLGQTEGQAVLTALQPRILTLAEAAAGADLAEIGAAFPARIWRRCSMRR